MPNKYDEIIRLLAFGLEPFDPQKHTQRDVGYGGPSTERLITEYDQDGNVVNLPSIWWARNGEPYEFDNDMASILSSEYEAATGKRFPRYQSLGSAIEHAMHRSARNGANSSRLTNVLGNF